MQNYDVACGASFIASTHPYGKKTVDNSWRVLTHSLTRSPLTHSLAPSQMKIRSRASARETPLQASPATNISPVSAAAKSTSSSVGPFSSSSAARRRPNSRRWPILAVAGASILILITIIYLFVAISQLSPSAASSGNLRSPPRGFDRRNGGTPTFGETTGCQYDGQCPVRFTCEATGAINGSSRGICKPIQSLGANDHTSCADACYTELKLDEHFYQETWPVLEWSEVTPQTNGRPKGCLLAYHREPEGVDRWKELQQVDVSTEWTEIPPSVKNWADNRFRHVIRVDPLSDDPEDKTWMAYCHDTCQTDADCATLPDQDGPPVALSGFVCIDSACQRNPAYWDRDKDETKPDMVIVTGATATYMIGLTNLASSLRYWAPHHKMVVYNLGGMSVSQIREIESWSNVLSVEWPQGVPKTYPSHVSRGKIYAWKPIIVNETVHRYSSIFWLDAGSTVVGPITPIENIIQRTGMMLVKGQDSDMKRKSHKATYEWFNMTKATFEAGPHYSGNTQAFMYPSRYIDSVVIPNCVCALDESCISPKGSKLGNHRYDQTTISILAYQPKVRAPHYTEYLAASHNQLNPDLRKPSFKFILTSRQTNQFYTELERKQ